MNGGYFWNLQVTYLQLGHFTFKYLVEWELILSHCTLLSALIQAQVTLQSTLSLFVLISSPPPFPEPHDQILLSCSSDRCSLVSLGHRVWQNMALCCGQWLGILLLRVLSVCNIQPHLKSAWVCTNVQLDAWVCDSLFKYTAFFFQWCNNPWCARASLSRLHDHTQAHHTR